jgi:hypothetical protein
VRTLTAENDLLKGSEQHRKQEKIFQELAERDNAIDELRDQLINRE